MDDFDESMYLRKMVEDETYCAIFIANGYKTKGTITYVNDDWILMLPDEDHWPPTKFRDREHDTESLIFRHAISTISQSSRNDKMLQFKTEGQSFIENLMKSEKEVKIIILNGYQFEGKIIGEDKNCFLVEDKYGHKSLIYKCNISTINVV